MDVEADVDRNSDLLIVIDLTTGKTKNILASRISVYWSINCSTFLLTYLQNTVCSSDWISAFQNPICSKFYQVYQFYLLYFTLSLIIIYLDYIFTKVEYLCHLSVTVCYSVLSMFMLYLQLGSQLGIMHFQWWVAMYWDGLEPAFFFYSCITKCMCNCVKDNYCPIRTIVYTVRMYYSKMVTRAEGSLLYQ